MSPPVLTRLPNPKANPPTITCIKPTKQMATHVATLDNFDAPFDAIQNAIYPSNILLSTLLHLTLLLT
jgi:hypothetical protein